jgi:hypothetical protein
LRGMRDVMCLMCLRYLRDFSCFWAWEGSFEQNNEKQFGGNGEQEEKNLIYCRF